MKVFGTSILVNNYCTEQYLLFLQMSVFFQWAFKCPAASILLTYVARHCEGMGVGQCSDRSIRGHSTRHQSQQNDLIVKHNLVKGNKSARYEHKINSVTLM